jgi:hypothetical protein
METFFEEPGVVQAELGADRTIVVHWRNLALGEVVRACCEAQLEKVREGARVIVVDTEDARWAPPQEIQEWFGDTLFPDLRDAGLAAIITVVPRSAVTRLASSRWKRIGEPFSFAMYEAESLDAATELARTLV